MPDATLQIPSPVPLTSFTEDEIMFRDNVRRFAEEKVRPLVKDMDEKGVFDPELIHQFFQLGLMGIEVPEQYGGGGGKVLRGDSGGGGDVASGCVRRRGSRRAEYAVRECSAALGVEEQKKRYLPRWRRTPWARTR